MLQITPDGKHFAECTETGAYIDKSRAQWTLIYDRNGVYEPRHWQRSKVSSEQIIERAQKSLDKIVAKAAQQGE